MKLKKLMALGLTATMIMGSSVVAFADEATVSPATGNVTGAGKLEGTVDTDVFNVVLPTTTADTLKFTLDPEGLIKATSNAAYSGATFGEGTLFFQTSSNNYTNTSQALSITNKSAVDVDVKLTASITGADGITLSEDKTFADDTSASMYMAIKTGRDEKAITEDGLTYAATINKAPDGAYEYKYTQGTGYSYELKADTSSITFEKLEFSLTGASNSAGDWSELASVTPSVNVTWDVQKHSDSPTFSSTSLGVIDYTKGSGNDALESITKIEMTNSSGTYDGYNALANTWADATDTGSKITFDSVYVAYYNANAKTDATITYTTAGGETKTASVEVITQ